jgi:outer membrane receptor protein involved in Fe transport
MRKRTAVLLGLSLMLLAPRAGAQRITGNVVGTVKDDTGAVLPGVTVSIAGEKIVGTQVTTTNAEGFYRLIALPPGSYDLSFTLSGFATLKRPGVKVAVGATEEIGVSLKVSHVNEEVTVTGEGAVVDTQTDQVSANYDKDWVRNAPVPRFSMFDLIFSAPGVSQSASGASTATSFGSGVDENSFQIDGTNLTSSFIGAAWPYPNTDAIEEIEVLSLGAPAEYGNLAGAVFNVVTRQGSNDFHGDANLYFQGDGLTGSNTSAEQDGGLPYHRETYKDATFQLSGPILKDKLWFFGSYQFQKNAFSAAGSDPDFPTTEKNHRLYGKLNWQLNPKHKLALAYHDDYYDLPLTVSAAYAPSTYTVDYGHNPTPQVMYTGVLLEKTVLEARFSGFYGKDHSGPINEGQPRIQTHFYDLDTGQRTGGIYYWYDDTAVQLGSSVKLSHFSDDFLGGSHDFKFGVQWLHGGVKDGVAATNDLVFTYDYTNYYGQTYRLAYGYDYRPFSYGGFTDGIGVFFDDAFRVGERLTLNLGARFDHNSARVPELDVLDQQGNPTGTTVPGRDVYSWSRVSPRLGLNYKLTKDGKTALRAHWGRYYRAVVVGEFVYPLGEPHETSSGVYDLATNSFIDPVVTESSQNQAIPPSYKPAYTDQLIGSVERELVKDIGLSLTYVYKRGRGIAAWRDVRGQYEDVTIVDDVGAEATGRSLTVKRLLTDPVDSFFEIANPPEMKTDTHAVTAELRKVMSHGWQARVSYTYLDSQGLLPSGRGGLTDTYGGTQAASLRFSDFGQNPNDLVNAGGKLLGDRPHTVKSQVVVELPHGFLVGANYLFQSGRAWVRFRKVEDLDNLGFPSAPNIQLEERGDRRLPSWNSLDLNVQKAFALGQKAKLMLFGYVLNTFNDGANEDVVSREATTEGFGVPTVFIPPRRVMLGAKITF